jgi:hypothetical protein
MHSKSENAFCLKLHISDYFIRFMRFTEQICNDVLMISFSFWRSWVKISAFLTEDINSSHYSFASFHIPSNLLFTDLLTNRRYRHIIWAIECVVKQKRTISLHQIRQYDFSEPYLSREIRRWTWGNRRASYVNMRYFRLPPRCKRRLRSSAMLSSIDW